MSEQERVLQVARRMERLRQWNPINGDCSNSLLPRAQKVLVAEFPACEVAIQDERRVIEVEREDDYRRLQRFNEELQAARVATGDQP